MEQLTEFPSYVTRVETVLSPSSSKPHIIKGLIIAGQNIGRYVVAEDVTYEGAVSKFLSLAEAAHKAR